MKINSENICEKCNGRGYLEIEACEIVRLYIRRCPECGGSGELDWVSKVTKFSILEARKNISMTSLIGKWEEENHEKFKTISIYDKMGYGKLNENKQWEM